MQDGREIWLGGSGGAPLAMCAVRSSCLDFCQQGAAQTRAAGGGEGAAAGVAAPVVHRLVIGSCLPCTKGHATVWSLLRPPHLGVANCSAPPHEEATGKGKKGRGGGAGAGKAAAVAAESGGGGGVDGWVLGGRGRADGLELEARDAAAL